MEAFMKKIAVVILTKNEEKNIVAVIENVCKITDEIIIIDSGSDDATVGLANLHGARVLYRKWDNDFSAQRNFVLDKTDADYILYIDADERITTSLKEEIINKINTKNNPISYYAIPRANHYLGKRVKHGGSYPDYVKRLYCKNKFKGYKGILHEEPIVDGPLEHLNSDLLHYTHRDLTSMVNKTLVWTDMEAQALFQNNHPPVVWWRFIRMILTKLWERLVKQQMWRDGQVGWVSAIFESYNTFLIYARLWELQQKQKVKI